MKPANAAAIAMAMLLVSGPWGPAGAADRPNILWLSTEDISCQLGCYGDPMAKTPTLDGLAAQGVRYDNACTHAPVCSVVRSGVITGVYPVSLGTHHHRSQAKLPPEVRCFTAYLRDAGYYCTNNSKEDYNFRPPRDAWDESSGAAHWRNRADARQPFFAVFNYAGTHESRFRGDRKLYERTVAGLDPEDLADAAAIVPPPYHPDTPAVRQTWAEYYNTIAALDDWVADHLRQLDEAGLAEETIVVFWSDHGMSLPRGKRWLYDSGVKIPLIVRVPEKYKRLAAPAGEGGVAAELVSSIDFAPTMLNLAGLPIPSYMQGRPFLGPSRPPERSHTYLHRDRIDERYDILRGVRTKRFKYIRNFMPWRPYTQWMSYGEASPIMQAWREHASGGDPTPEQAAFFARTKPAEELYDLQNDPHETNNLAENKSYEPVRKDLAAWLQAWMQHTKDLGLVPESYLAEPTNEGVLRYERFRRIGGDTEYQLLLNSALASTQPGVSDEAGLNAVFAVYLAMQTPADVPASTLWSVSEGHRMPAPAGGAGRRGVEIDLTLRGRVFQTPTLGIAVAELLLASAAKAEAAPESAEPVIQGLASLLSTKADVHDRLQAANALDVLPDLAPFAEQLRPAIYDARRALKRRAEKGSAARNLRLCLDRLEQRLDESGGGPE
ncbi:MAG: sulfatase [Planctomycetota bacterium]